MTDLSQAIWRKARRSSHNGGCVEIAANLEGVAAVRDSKRPEGGAHVVDRRAFAEFLRLNPDGPFIIASHSQGSIHALRLLQEKIAGTALQRRMIAAYAIGVAMPRQITQLGLPLCTSADATGCLITWNSVRQAYGDHRRLEDSVIWWQGSYQPIAGRPIVCTNPLDWRLDSAAPPSANLGAVYSAGRLAAVPAPIPMVTGAICESGLLGVQIRLGEKRYFSDALTLVGIYHDLDYGLFYMNIRENVAVRIRAWQTSRR